MAHFAELNSSNEVLRVIVVSNDDVNANGGDLHADAETLIPASEVLGHLAKAGGTLTVDFVQFEVTRALEWLQSDRHASRLLVATLVLKELAENAPVLFYSHVGYVDYIYYIIILTNPIILL